MEMHVEQNCSLLTSRAPSPRDHRRAEKCLSCLQSYTKGWEGRRGGPKGGAQEGQGNRHGRHWRGGEGSNGWEEMRGRGRGMKLGL